MPDDPNTNSTSNPAPSAPATPTQQAPAPAQQPAPQPTAISREEFEAALKRERDSAFAEARRLFEGKGKAKSSNSTNNRTEDTSTSTSFDELAFRDGLNDAMAELSGLTKSQRRILRDAALRARPDDVEAFVAEFAADAGWSSSTQAPAAQQQQQQQQSTQAPANTNNNSSAPSKPAPYMPAPAGTQPTDFGMGNVLGWDDATWKAYVRSKGGDPTRPYDPRNRPVFREIRQLIEAQGSTVRVLK